MIMANNHISSINIGENYKRQIIRKLRLSFLMILATCMLRWIYTSTIKAEMLIGHFEVEQGTGSSHKFSPIHKLTPHHNKDHFQISHLTKFGQILIFTNITVISLLLNILTCYLIWVMCLLPQKQPASLIIVLPSCQPTT